MTARPSIALTTGDPSGIGPEIVAKAVARADVASVCTPVVFGPRADDARARFPIGRVDESSGRAAYDAIVAATAAARAGSVDALVTAPVSKAAFQAAGLPWKGHTDLLAHLCGVEDVAMLFWSEPLKVVLATVHVPLAAVPALVTPARVEATVRLTARALPAFGIAGPRVAVAGLNPHAGEQGVIGREELDVIGPALSRLRAEGLDVTGPHPADTVFVRASRGEFDVVVAMYHDQGLVPVKLLSFGRAVNVTLGLPIVRTSVDHGTAFDIAGKGRADERSLVEAIHVALRLVAARPAQA
jgi:4-hydroxythreonine-4-phosphate dehydrogenase